MPMKILKDAGVAPPEIAMFHERAHLRSLIAATTDAADLAKLRQQLNELELRINSKL